MAGIYPDVPAPRMAYDRDGSVGFQVASNGTINVISLADMQQINDEDDGAYSTAYSDFDTPGFGRIGILFPELRDLAAYFLAAAAPTNLTALETTTDSTNGVDGTWTARGTPVVSAGVNTAFRTAITSLAVLGIKGIRFRINQTAGSGGFGFNMRAFHLYGAIAAGQNPDRLRMWHPTLNEPLDDNTSADGAFFDWGDIQRNATSDKTFRIKNNSATLTASGIVISQETLTDTTPTVNSQFTFSDGGAFAASINIGNLAPGAVSVVITKRYTRPSNAILSLWTSRTIANPTSWA